MTPGRRMVPGYAAVARLGPPDTANLDRLRDPLTVLSRRGGWLPPVLEPASRRMAGLLDAGPAPLVEIAATLSLSVGTARIVAADLLGSQVVEARPPVLLQSGQSPDVSLLQRVLDGLNNLVL